MFELTLNGQTRQFDSAAEMEEWRERMKPHKPKKQKRWNTKDKSTKPSNHQR